MFSGSEEKETVVKRLTKKLSLVSVFNNVDDIYLAAEARGAPDPADPALSHSSSFPLT